MPSPKHATRCTNHCSPGHRGDDLTSSPPSTPGCNAAVSLECQLNDGNATIGVALVAGLSNISRHDNHAPPVTSVPKENSEQFRGCQDLWVLRVASNQPLHRLCGPQSIRFEFNLAVVLTGGVLNALTTALNPERGHSTNSSFRRGLPGYLIPVCSTLSSLSVSYKRNRHR